MPNVKELDRELVERLYDLLVIKAANEGIKVKELDRAITRAKAPMSEEQIAWVEKLVNEIMASEM